MPTIRMCRCRLGARREDRQTGARPRWSRPPAATATSHGVSADADRKWLTLALVLIVGFMAAEVVVGVVAGSLALITDAGHMLTDAASIVLALVAIRLAARPARGGYTYGLKRAEILSAQANGITLLLLAAYFVFEGVRRLIDPGEVEGLLVFVTALVGIVVNVAASWCISRANRSSLNVEGAYQHILNDLYAFIATAIAGAVVWLTGFARADAIAALIVGGADGQGRLGSGPGVGPHLPGGRPEGRRPRRRRCRTRRGRPVVEVHDLHIWEITSGEAALSAHVIVGDGADCHAIRGDLERILHDRHHIDHTTLQVDHVCAEDPDEHCVEPHGQSYRGA